MYTVYIPETQDMDSFGALIVHTFSENLSDLTAQDCDGLQPVGSGHVAWLCGLDR